MLRLIRLWLNYQSKNRFQHTKFAQIVFIPRITRVFHNSKKSKTQRVYLKFTKHKACPIALRVSSQLMRTGTSVSMEWADCDHCDSPVYIIHTPIEGQCRQISNLACCLVPNELFVLHRFVNFSCGATRTGILADTASPWHTQIHILLNTMKKHSLT